MTMVVGMFERLSSAQRAVADLMASGYERERISVLVRRGSELDRDGYDEEHGMLSRVTKAVSQTSVLAGGPLAARFRDDEGEAANEHSMSDALVAAGLRPAAAHFFADAIFNGAILVAVHCGDAQVLDAREILDLYAEPEERPEGHGAGDPAQR